MIDINTPLGTRCRIIDNKTHHGQKIGTIVTLSRVNNISSLPPYVEVEENSLCYYLADLELAESPSPFTHLFSHTKLLSQT